MAGYGNMDLVLNAIETAITPGPYLLGDQFTAADVYLDRKSTRLNSSHTEIYTLSLHDALPIYGRLRQHGPGSERHRNRHHPRPLPPRRPVHRRRRLFRSEEHTSELQSHRDLHSFPTRRSSDLWPATATWTWF